MGERETGAIVCSFCGEECGHRSEEIEALRALLYQALVNPDDDPATYGVVLDHRSGTAHIGSGSQR